MICNTAKEFKKKCKALAASVRPRTRSSYAPSPFHPPCVRFARARARAPETLAQNPPHPAPPTLAHKAGAPGPGPGPGPGAKGRGPGPGAHAPAVRFCGGEGKGSEALCQPGPAPWSRSRSSGDPPREDIADDPGLHNSAESNLDSEQERTEGKSYTQPISHLTTAFHSRWCYPYSGEAPNKSHGSPGEWG